MGLCQNVYRRGGVYWWKGRIADGAPGGGGRTLALSLGVRDPDAAREIGARLTAEVRVLRRERGGGMLTGEVASQILRGFVAEYREQHDRLRNVERQYGGGLDPQTARDELVEACCFRLLAEQNVNRVEVGENDRARMRAEGLTDAEIRAVEVMELQHCGDRAGSPFRGDGVATLASMEHRGFARPKAAYDHILSTHGVELLPVRRMQVEQLDYAARAATLRESAGLRACKPVDHAAMALFLAEETRPLDYVLQLQEARGSTSPLNAGDFQVQPLSSGADVAPAIDQPSVPPGLPAVRAAGAWESAAVVDLGAAGAAHDPDGAFPARVTITQIIESYIAEKARNKEFNLKTSRQIASACALFVKVVGTDDPTQVRLEHIIRYRDVLAKLSPTRGRSPEDEHLPLDKLLAKAKASSRPVGLAPGTINRHMIQLCGIVEEIVLRRGHDLDRPVPWKRLRVRDAETEGEKRRPFHELEEARIFGAPPWTGSLSLKSRLLAGDIVLHDALYWVPLIGRYTAGRREEICGLMADEIIDDELGQGVLFQDNAQRKLKNRGSRRRLPLHPELIRLGLLEYARAVRAAGHDLLFPELKLRAPNTKMGDTFYKEWCKLLDLVLSDRKETEVCFHCFRHTLSDHLKNEGVPSEIRGDILGHGGKGTTERVYSTPANQAVLLEALMCLPITTAHIEARTVCLSPLLKSTVPRAVRPRKPRQADPRASGTTPVRLA